jgi:16S rRNA (guanine966-N2)-methyltransferase
MVRIIGGRWKRKQLVVLNKENIRPTPSRIRETVFNWLTLLIDLSDSKVLDMFCGSGALGIEAASRGAKQVTLVDCDQDVVNQLNFLICSLENSKNVKTVCAEAIRWLKTNQSEKFDLIFLDPPFGSLLLKETLPILYDQVNEDGLIYVEYDKEICSLFDSTVFEVIRNSKSGAVMYYLIKKKSFKNST